MSQDSLNSEIAAGILDASSIPIFAIDKDHRVIFWNTAMEALSGLQRDSMLGTDEQWRAFYAARRPVLADLIIDGVNIDLLESRYPGRYNKSLLIEGAYEAEGFFLDLGKDGKWLRFTAGPIRDDAGTVVAVVETLEDITERKRAEEALHASEKSYRALFEDARDAIWVQDLDGFVQTANQACADLSGVPLDELPGKNVKNFISSQSLEMAREVSRRLKRNLPIKMPYEVKLLRPDGSEALCMVSTNLVIRDGAPVGFQNIARDVTQEKRMQEKLRFYLRQITRAQEEERKRIARELHDNTAQLLGSLSRQVDNFIRDSRYLSTDEISFLKELQTQLNDGVKEIHRFIQDLLPPILDTLGLVPAVRDLTKNLPGSEGLKAELEVIGDGKRFSPEVELLLFRIMQEALNNVVRHAHATEARVTIDFTGEGVRVTITDNGRGFKLNRFNDIARSSKLGLMGMQERTQLLGGKLEIKSAPRRGTSILIEVPA